MGAADAAGWGERRRGGAVDAAGVGREKMGEVRCGRGGCGSVGREKKGGGERCGRGGCGRCGAKEEGGDCVGAVDAASVGRGKKGGMVWARRMRPVGARKEVGGAVWVPWMRPVWGERRWGRDGVGAVDGAGLGDRRRGVWLVPAPPILTHVYSFDK